MRRVSFDEVLSAHQGMLGELGRKAHYLTVGVEDLDARLLTERDIRLIVTLDGDVSIGSGVTALGGAVQVDTWGIWHGDHAVLPVAGSYFVAGYVHLIGSGNVEATLRLTVDREIVAAQRCSGVGLHLSAGILVEAGEGSILRWEVETTGNTTVREGSRLTLHVVRS